MLTKNYQRQLDIPHEPEEWITIRMLSWQQLENAREQRNAQVMKSVKDLDLEAMGLKPDPVTAQKAAETAAAAPDAVTNYDRLALLSAGVVEWSYDDEVSGDALLDLDEMTAKWLVNEIYALSRRSDAEVKDSSGQ